MPARSTPCSVMSDPATISSPTSRCLPSPMWTGKIRIQFMNSWRAGVLQLGQNSRLLTSSTMSPTTKMTLGGLSKIKQILLWTHSRWNFEKFLVNHKGQPVRRYDESLDPSKLVSIFRRYPLNTSAFNRSLVFCRSQILTFFWSRLENNI